jgi:hypothetical protein
VRRPLYSTTHTQHHVVDHPIPPGDRLHHRGPRARPDRQTLRPGQETQLRLPGTYARFTINAPRLAFLLTLFQAHRLRPSLQARDRLCPPLRLPRRCRLWCLRPRPHALLGAHLTLRSRQGRFCLDHAPLWFRLPHRRLPPHLQPQPEPLLRLDREQARD